MSAFSKRFQPVRIQAVQSGQFHSRKQRSSKKVDDYAQELSQLCQQAYPQTDQGSREAEEMGQKVLALSVCVRIIARAEGESSWN